MLCHVNKSTTCLQSDRSSEGEESELEDGELDDFIAQDDYVLDSEPTSSHQVPKFVYHLFICLF